MRAIKSMTALVAVAVAVGMACMVPVTEARNAQNEKMTTCNADAKAKALKGADRKTFMKSCLSDPAAAAKSLTPQQQKMVDCNKDASGKALKGADRKAFMKTCLKG